MKVTINENEKFSYLDPKDWQLNFKWMKCPTHNQGAGLWIYGMPNEVNVELDVCCEEFFDEIAEKKCHFQQFKENIKSLDERAANSEISETIIVGGEEIPEVEIISLAWSSAGGNILWLTGNREIKVPDEDLGRIKEYLEQRDKIRGVVRIYKINGERIKETEIIDIIYENEMPYLKLIDGRMLPIKPPEIYALEHIIAELKKSRR